MIRCGPGRFGFQSSHCYFDWCLILSPCFGDQSVRLLSGIAAILDAIQPPGKFGPVLQQNQLDDSAVKLKEQEYDLLIAEMEYDIKSFRVWKRKIQDHDIRLLSLKDEWMMKRYAAAKTAMELFLDMKA